MVSQLVAMDGLDLGFMSQKFPIIGTWSYNPGTIYLNLLQDAFGQKHPINIQVHPTNNSENELSILANVFYTYNYKKNCDKKGK